MQHRERRPGFHLGALGNAPCVNTALNAKDTYMVTDRLIFVNSRRPNYVTYLQIPSLSQLLFAVNGGARHA
jgi:hypothetical protein